MVPLHSLRSLRPGARAWLVSIGGERSFRRRLMELGLLPGTELRVVRNLEVGGVLELEVRRCRLSIRRTEAEELFVSPEPPESRA